VRKIWCEGDDRRRRRNRVALGALALIGFGAVLQFGTGLLQPARHHLHKVRLEVGRESLSRLHYALLQRNLVEVNSPGSLPSSAVPDESLCAGGLPTLSIVTDERGLHSREYGIIANPLKRGRFWERQANISYFEGGKLRHETTAGLRVHGGTSRSDVLKSFKIIFRRSYSGETGSPPGLFFNGESLGTRRFVLSNTRAPVRYLNALALELAAELGCETSRLQPVRLVLNGERMPAGYFLLEHQSRDLLRARYGHNRFLWVRLKPASETRNFARRRFSRFMRRVRRHPGPVTAEEIGRQFDLDGLSSWILAVTFFATTDEDQGGYYLDQTDPEARWRSLTWDMDGSFNKGEKVETHTFHFDSVKGARGRLFRTLMRDDPAYREAFLGKAQAELDTHLSPERLRALFARYRGYLDTDLFAGQERLREQLDNAEAFLIERHALYLDALRQYIREIARPALAGHHPGQAKD